MAYQFRRIGDIRRALGRERVSRNRGNPLENLLAEEVRIRYRGIILEICDLLHEDLSRETLCDGYSLRGYTATVLPPSGVICDLSYTI